MIYCLSTPAGTAPLLVGSQRAPSLAPAPHRSSQHCRHAPHTLLVHILRRRDIRGFCIPACAFSASCHFSARALHTARTLLPRAISTRCHTAYLLRTTPVLPRYRCRDSALHRCLLYRHTILPLLLLYRAVRFAAVPLFLVYALPHLPPPSRRAIYQRTTRSRHSCLASPHAFPRAAAAACFHCLTPRCAAPLPQRRALLTPPIARARRYCWWSTRASAAPALRLPAAPALLPATFCATPCLRMPAHSALPPRGLPFAALATLRTCLCGRTRNIDIYLHIAVSPLWLTRLVDSRLFKTCARVCHMVARACDNVVLLYRTRPQLRTAFARTAPYSTRWLHALCIPPFSRLLPVPRHSP